jgi:Transposase IS200 like
MSVSNRKRWIVPWKDSREKPAIYHCLSRVVDRRFVFEVDEREHFRTLLRMCEKFTGCRVLSYCIMSNHFHILLEVPPLPEEGISDEELLGRLAVFYTPAQVADIAKELADAATPRQRGEFEMAPVIQQVRLFISFIGTTISDFTIRASGRTGGLSAQLNASLGAGYIDEALFDGALIADSDARVGRALYVFVGNGASLAQFDAVLNPTGSTAWALKQVGTIAGDDGGENDYNANPFGGVAPIIGSINPSAFTGDPAGLGGGTYSALQLVAVPEPSAALLGAIGALGLLRRRRI